MTKNNCHHKFSSRSLRFRKEQSGRRGFSISSLQPWNLLPSSNWHTRNHNSSERDFRLIGSSPFSTTVDLCHQCNIYYYLNLPCLAKSAILWIPIWLDNFDLDFLSSNDTPHNHPTFICFALSKLCRFSASIAHVSVPKVNIILWTQTLYIFPFIWYNAPWAVRIWEFNPSHSHSSSSWFLNSSLLLVFVDKISFWKETSLWCRIFPGYYTFSTFIHRLLGVITSATQSTHGKTKIAGETQGPVDQEAVQVETRSELIWKKLNLLVQFHRFKKTYLQFN